MNFKKNFTFLLDVSGKERYKLYASAVLSVTSALLAIVPYLLMASIIMGMIDGDMTYDTLKSKVFLVCFIVLIRLVSFLASGVFSHVAAFTILYELRMKAVKHLAKLNMGYFTESTLGGIKKTLNEDVERLENFIAHQIPDLAAAVVAPLIIIGYLLYLNWILACILLLPIILGLLAQMTMFKGMEENMNKYHKLLHKLNSTIIQYVNGINVMKAFNLSAKSFKNYTDVTREYADLWEDMTRKSAKNYGIFLVLIDSGLLFIIPAGGWLFLTGRISASVYIMFLVLCSNFLASFKHLLEFGMNFSMLLEGAGKVQALLEEEVQREGSIVLQSALEGQIEYDHISFKYKKEWVVKDFSLKIEPGKVIALVGPSGSGKTTIGQLLGRFWDVECGSIRIDGHDIKDFEMANLMNHISFVFQDVFILHDTVRENIRMGLDCSDEAIIDASKKAQIHDLIQSLPEGYDTILGEKGIKLSGGEKQRISVARAILKNSSIVVLDEITSYSDIENESKIQMALEKLLENKTAIVIAHRLYTIKNADCIVVLDEGRVVESGTHNELMKKGGLYHGLWTQYDAQIVERGA